MQENIELLRDGYEGDVLGESTPDALVNEFVSLCFSKVINIAVCKLFVLCFFDSLCITRGFCTSFP